MNKTLLLSLLMLFAVVACGQKGPLYLPSDQPAVETISEAVIETEENSEHNTEQSAD